MKAKVENEKKEGLRLEAEHEGVESLDTNTHDGSMNFSISSGAKSDQDLLGFNESRDGPPRQDDSWSEHLYSGHEDEE